jgi:hypothetical protein
MKNSFLGRNGLSIALVALFLVFMIGQTYFGWHDYNAGQGEHSQPETTLARYLTTGHFQWRGGGFFNISRKLARAVEAGKEISN